MFKYRLLLLLPLILTLTACGLFPEEEDESRNWSAQKLYSEASEAMSDGDYQNAIKYYELLEASYPFGKYAMQAQLGVAYAYYKAEEFDSAIAALDRFIKMHPRAPEVDYAYYMKGVVNYNRTMGVIERFMPVDESQRNPGAAMSSFQDFAQLVEKFPQSEYSSDARKRMAYLLNNMARHEVHVANYYYKRGAYLASANRAKAVLENYSTTPAVKPALEVMIQAYEALGMQDLAADARRVLKINLEKGNIAQEPTQEEVSDISLSRRVWEFLKLDED